MSSVGNVSLVLYSSRVLKIVLKISDLFLAFFFLWTRLSLRKTKLERVMHTFKFIFMLYIITFHLASILNFAASSARFLVSCYVQY